MPDQLEVKIIGAEVVRLSLQPGDVLVLSHPGRWSREDHEKIEASVKETFGVPAVLLTDGMKLDALLSVSRECLELAAEARDAAAEKQSEYIRKIMESVSNTKRPE